MTTPWLWLYGPSGAGAAVLGATIETVAHLDLNDTDRTDHRGMDLLDGASVWVHYEPRDDVRIAHFLERHPASAVIALPLDAGAILDRGIVTSTGSSPIRIIADSGDVTLEAHESAPLRTSC